MLHLQLAVDMQAKLFYLNLGIFGPVLDGSIQFRFIWLLCNLVARPAGKMLRTLRSRPAKIQAATTTRRLQHSSGWSVREHIPTVLISSVGIGVGGDPKPLPKSIAFAAARTDTSPLRALTC